MSKRLAGFCSAAAVLGFLALPAGAFAQEMPKKPASEPVTLTKAQVIDLHCLVASGIKGEGHKECAVACANVGVPLGLLTADGKILVPVSPTPMQDQNKKLKDLAEQFVNVKGKLYKGAGVQGIQIEEISKA